MNLEPGQSGKDVEQLQRWLIEQGYDIPALSNGSASYGYYGEQTKQALANWQRENGVQTGGYDGFYGPQTQQTISQRQSLSPNAPAGNEVPEDFANTARGTTTEQDAELESLLSGLPDDQRAAVQAIYDAVAAFDTEKAQQLIAGIDAAAGLNDPYFSAQLRLVKDALERGMTRLTEDLSFEEQSRQQTLQDIRDDVARQSENLTLDQQQELRSLDRELDQSIKTTRQDAASRGFTSSSARAEAEQLLQSTAGDLRESTNRKFGFQQTTLQNTETRATRDTQSEIERLRQLTQRNKEDIFRTGEEQLGTKNLPSLSGFTPLGNVPGSIPRAQAADTLSAGMSFVF